jgi:hypothetical protein
MAGTRANGNPIRLEGGTVVHVGLAFAEEKQDPA